ncbi:MAG: hypothetical protein MI919_35450, partial [Holophagales bacterium]|nr:hypothetical protein [Holophagales bacterium]
MSRSQRGARSQGPGGAPGGVGRILAVVLAVAFVVLAVERFESVRKRLGAARIVTAVEASTVLASSQGQQPPERLLRGNLAILEKAAVLDPTEVRVPLAAGASWFLLGRYPAACRAYEDAAEIENRAEVFANLGRCRLALGQRKEAMRAIRKAIRLDRNQRKHFRAELKRDAQIQRLREPTPRSSRAGASGEG